MSDEADITEGELERFRARTADWLEANCPAQMHGPAASDEDTCWGGRRLRFASAAQGLWLERMVAQGWTAPEWPREYGGAGLDPARARILREQMRRLDCRAPLTSFGISMLAPALLRFATEAQRREHLPRIARGEIRWCQGYSEPGAGSDLASLATRAEDRGDHFLVNGQKIWTSYADQSDWIFCLVRTDTTAAKHKGISFLLIDMDTPGVTTRPIRLISGKSPFCETFFENVRVPKDNLVGAPGGGWEIAKYLLTHERESIGSMDLLPHGAAELHDLAVSSVGMEHGRLADGMLRAELARWQVDSLALRLTLERLREEAGAGQGLGAGSSVLKYYGTELNKRKEDLAMSIAGVRGLLWRDTAHGVPGGAQTARAWLRSKGNSIEGGTSEIQLNIIAKHLLGLPGA
ncbi:MAG: acyl-CoA dehydrogenase [Proteobacteria bacterium]|nr:acyl-CoA dehydrogenase [Pseudomonadota bacterium]